MSIKYNYDEYNITCDFKSDLKLTMTASDTFSGDIFINQNVELNKIKKDTVIAALSRKNEKALRCKFNVVDVEPKKLIIAFEVSFDFLPTFTEYVSLDQLQNKGSGLNKVESAELRSDIEDLQKLINNISCREAYVTADFSNNNLNEKIVVFDREMEKGSYLLEASGNFTCAQGNKHDLTWTVNTGSQKSEIKTSMHNNSGYSYPFSIRKQFILQNSGKVTLLVESKHHYQSTFSNGIVSLSPMIKTK